MYFRLAGVIDTPQTIYVIHKVKKPDGYYKRGEHMRLQPGVIYDTDGDEIFERSIRALGKKKIRWTKEMEARMKEMGVEYTVDMCKSCGGSVKKIIFSEIEEVAHA